MGGWPGYAWVFAGGGLGAVLRHGVGALSLRAFGPSFPWGTLIVNVVGSLAMGLLIAGLSALPGGASNSLRLFLATGLLGGFTTFSAFSLDVLTLWERGAILPALGYVAASLVLSFAGIAAGFALGRAA